MKLSETEQEALKWLQSMGGTVLVSKIPDKTERDCLDVLQPGMTIFRKLEKKGLVFITEEEPVELEEGVWFEFTPSVELVK